MNFDQYQRYETIRQLIEEVRGHLGQPRLRILEVGANEQRILGDFLPGDDILYSDILLPEGLAEDSRFVQAGGDDLSLFEADAFDVVVSLDVFEHVPPERRMPFLRETNRVAKYACLHGFPYGSPANVEAENNANRHYAALSGTPHIWLEEHREMGLPALAEVQDLYAGLKAGVFHFEHGDTRVWEEIMKALFSTYFTPLASPYLESIYGLYAGKIYQHDVGKDNYRTYFVACKERKLLEALRTFSAGMFSAPPRQEDLALLYSCLGDLEAICRQPVLRAEKDRETTMKLYSDAGQGFTEENVVVDSISLPDEGYFHAKFPLRADAKRIRFDPAEGRACMVFGLEVTLDGALLEGPFSSNGAYLNQLYFFNRLDPQIYITLRQPAQMVELQGRIVVYQDSLLLSMLSNVYFPFGEYPMLRQQNEELREKKASLEQAHRALNARFQENVIFLNSEVERAERKIRELRAQNDNETAQLEALQEAFTQQEFAYQQLLQSSFWRMTKPLRQLVNLFKKKSAMAADAETASRYQYMLDAFEVDGRSMFLRGWVFDKAKKLEDVSIVVQCEGEEFTLKAATHLSRDDVTKVYNSAYAKNAGFTCNFIAYNAPFFRVYLRCGAGSDREDILLKAVHLPDIEVAGEPKFEAVSWTDVPVEEFARFSSGHWLSGAPEFDSRLYGHTIDLIVPVYNGFEYLQRLFETIPLTQMDYRVFVIDDRSPDGRVWPYLQQLRDEDERIILLRNEENLGFVQTVNAGFEHAENAVAILNTDIELPQNWLERLMAPILLQEDVASTTPFTNCGTVCSFPNIGQDCELFAGLSCQEIDDVFSQMIPMYTPMPTGIGFCMGISAAALKEVGYFDAQTFAKGYGEENDWCQRAIRRGWKNVLVENLFVWHKHGGSFLNAEKQALQKRNSAALEKRYPQYNKDVAVFFRIDPAKYYRALAIIELLSKHGRGKAHLVFNHNLGGGANAYLEQRMEAWLAAGDSVVLVQYSEPQSTHYVTVFHQDSKAAFRLGSLQELDEVLALVPPAQVLVNELVSYPDIQQVLAYLPAITARFGCPLVYLLHDFYAICPTINFMQPNGKCCCETENSPCVDCLADNPYMRYPQGATIQEWREAWGGFLQQCTEVLTFSEASRRILKAAYPSLGNVQMIPHKARNMPRLAYPKATGTVNIGLIGALDDIKGLAVLEEMLELTADRKDVRFVLIGYAARELDYPHFHQTGPYTLGALPRLVVENDIDVVFISSTVPETFSYTSAEAVKMGLPIASFNLGAQAEHVARAGGLLLEEISAKSAVRQLLAYGKEMAEKRPKPAGKGRVLFVVEYESASSRYRADHFGEELLLRGVATEQILLSDIATVHAEEYTAVVLYRCPLVPGLNTFLKKAGRNGTKVYYDIDDKVFRYGKADKYAADIKAAMQLCDGIFTPTGCLADEVKHELRRPVFVNRNVASMEMLVISLNTRPRPADKKVVLGYCNGAATPNGDFGLVLPAVLRVMEKYENVHLQVVGAVEIPPELKEFSRRITALPLVDWRELPGLMAGVDINLMPQESGSCKSENKWMEAALVKVPTVLSSSPEMAAVISDGETGCLCGDAQAFETAVSGLIESPDKRAAMGQRAHEQVMAHYLTLNAGQDAIGRVAGR